MSGPSFDISARNRVVRRPQHLVEMPKQEPECVAGHPHPTLPLDFEDRMAWLSEKVVQQLW